jgi:hypothetical protein
MNIEKWTTFLGSISLERLLRLSSDELLLNHEYTEDLSDQICKYIKEKTFEDWNELDLCKAHMMQKIPFFSESARTKNSIVKMYINVDSLESEWQNILSDRFKSTVLLERVDLDSIAPLFSTDQSQLGKNASKIKQMHCMRLLFQNGQLRSDEFKDMMDDCMNKYTSQFISQISHPESENQYDANIPMKGIQDELKLVSDYSVSSKADYISNDNSFFYSKKIFIAAALSIFALAAAGMYSTGMPDLDLNSGLFSKTQSQLQTQNDKTDFESIVNSNNGPEKNFTPQTEFNSNQEYDISSEIRQLKNETNEFATKVFGSESQILVEESKGGRDTSPTKVVESNEKIDVKEDIKIDESEKSGFRKWGYWAANKVSNAVVHGYRRTRLW